MKKIPKIKICGITNKEDALVVANLRPNYLGFIIDYPKSPRSIASTQVKEIVSLVRKKHGEKIALVGVFVNKDLKEVKKIMKRCQLDIAQLHGDETPSYVSRAKKEFEVWKTVIIHKLSDIKKIDTHRGIANKILLDTGKGSGKRINLALVKNQSIDILAGGLSTKNIKSTLEIVSPRVVDVNSKLELKPGIKDIRRVREFIKKVRS